MIPIVPQREPANFDTEVRQPGLRWLEEHGIAVNEPPPDSSELPTYWRRTQKELWTAYQGVCAYLCIYFEWSLGAQSTDHFVAKSAHAGMAYEWANFRLSCMGMNRNKNKFDDILDPFEIAPETFHLNLVSGQIRPNPELSAEIQDKAKATIQRLKLNDPDTCRMRAEHFSEYIRNDVSERKLRQLSPFVWFEAKRQRFL
jgi:uncharacterized protein (TIGR02646 family)